MSKIRNEASRASFSPAVRRLADHLEAQEHAVQFYDVIALGGLDKALDIEEIARVLAEHGEMTWSASKQVWVCDNFECRAEVPDDGTWHGARRAHAATALRASVLDVPTEATP
jgi:hypothetical protein